MDTASNMITGAEGENAREARDFNFGGIRGWVCFTSPDTVKRQRAHPEVETRIHSNLRDIPI